MTGRFSGLLAASLAVTLAVPSSADGSEEARLSTSPSMSASGGQEAQAGCCSDPDVLRYENVPDLASLPDGREVNDQFRTMGVLFGRGASPLAPRTVVRTDYSRSTGCRKVLNGDPVFQGWEFFIFVDPVQSRWAAVQSVGASVGYCDQVNGCFIAAYDWTGRLLEAKFNDTIGFQFLKIERAAADINSVLIGDCLNVSRVCYPDPGGSALNCLTFSTTTSTNVPLPGTVAVPDPPFRDVPLPAATALGLAILGVVLGGAAAWAAGRRTGAAR